MAKLKIEFEFDEDKIPMAVHEAITDAFSSLTQLIDTINTRQSMFIMRCEPEKPK